MQPWLIFSVGAIGALAPEVVRLYSLRTKGAKFTAFYFVISAIFALLGGFVSLILPAATLWGAFYTGLSVPVVVSTAIRKGLTRGDADFRDYPSDRSRVKNDSPSLFAFVNAL